MKNDASELTGDQRGDEIVAGILLPGLAHLLHHLRQLGAGGEDGRGHGRRVVDIVDVLRVAEAEDDVGAVEDELLLAAGYAHHVDDDPERQPRRDLGHEVALAPFDDLVDDAGGHAFDVRTHRLELAGREAPGHDAA
jgi:hypothetical protein